MIVVVIVVVATGASKLRDNVVHGCIHTSLGTWMIDRVFLDGGSEESRFKVCQKQHRGQRCREGACRGFQKGRWGSHGLEVVH